MSSCLIISGPPDLDLILESKAQYKALEVWDPKGFRVWRGRSARGIFVYEQYKSTYIKIPTLASQDDMALAQELAVRHGLARSQPIEVEDPPDPFELLAPFTALQGDLDLASKGKRDEAHHTVAIPGGASLLPVADYVALRENEQKATWFCVPFADFVEALPLSRVDEFTFLMPDTGREAWSELVACLAPKASAHIPHRDEFLKSCQEILVTKKLKDIEALKPSAPSANESSRSANKDGYLRRVKNLSSAAVLFVIGFTVYDALANGAKFQSLLPNLLLSLAFIGFGYSLSVLGKKLDP